VRQFVNDNSYGVERGQSNLFRAIHQLNMLVSGPRSDLKADQSIGTTAELGQDPRCRILDFL
jgi:hypothetical protein